MAFTFKRGKLASDQINTLLASGVNSSVEIPDGSLVQLGSLINDTVYFESGDHDYPEYDTYNISYAIDAAEMNIVDYAGISEGEIGDNNYKMGIKLFDLKVPAGYPTRVRRLQLHDKYWIGNGNIEDSSVSVGDILSVGSNGKHKINTSGTFKAKVISEREFTVGMKDDGKLYLVEVIAL